MNNQQKITIRIESSFMEIIRKEAQMRGSSIQSVINRFIHKGIDYEMYNKSTFDRINEIRKRSIKGSNRDLVKESRKSMK
jgi:hypothetical protein